MFQSSTITKKLLFFILGGAILIGGGAGAALYTKAWDPQWNPFRPSPEEVFQAATEKLIDLKTFHSQVAGTVKFQKENQEIFTISVQVDGDFDQSNLENPRSRGTLNGKFSTEGLDFSFGMEFRAIGDTGYLKFTTIPAFPFLQGFAQEQPQLDQLKNQWIKYDAKELWTNFSKEEKQKLNEYYTKQKQLQNEILKEYIKLVKEGKFYEVRQQLPDERIGNAPTYHYAFALKVSDARPILSKVLKSLPYDSQQFSEEQLRKTEQLFDKFFQAIGEIPGEAWIGKRDMLTYKTTLKKEISVADFVKAMVSPEFLGETNEEDLPKGNILFDFEINFSHFNKQISIEPPQDAKGFEEIFGTSLFRNPVPPHL